MTKSEAIQKIEAALKSVLYCYSDDDIDFAKERVKEALSVLNSLRDEWQSISTAPINKECMFYQKRSELFEDYFLGPFQQIGCINEDGHFNPSGIGGYEWECELDKPDYWLPLPEPPETDEKK